VEDSIKKFSEPAKAVSMKRGVKQNRLLGSLVLILSAAGLAGAGESRPSWRSEWERTVEAAKREGQVNVYQYSQVFDPVSFERAFPGIQVSFVTGRGGVVAQRILAERRAGKYLADLSLEGLSTNYLVFYNAKLLDPIKPLLILPEVVDLSRWWGGKHHYTDTEEEYIFEFFGVPQAGTPAYNTNLVNPSELRSHWDLVRPKWKEKIGLRDITVPGHGEGNMRFLYYHPELGPKFIKRLFGEMDVVVFRDFRQGTDWLAQGRLALCYGCPDTDQAKRQGLPVERLGILREGAGLTAQAGTVALLSKAPHPNAAKVLVNWLLSREGQINSAEYLAKSGRNASDSFRIDVPKDLVPPEGRRVEGVKYFRLDNPEWADMRPVRKAIEEALAGGKTR
jgi:ABC-type Fe3+ transport system substrate-binding protein